MARLAKTLDIILGDVIRHDHPEVTNNADNIDAVSAEVTGVVAAVGALSSVVINNAVDIQIVSGAHDDLYSVVETNSGVWNLSGEVSGVVSSTPVSVDNSLVRFDGPNGDIIQGSNALLDDQDNLTLNSVNGDYGSLSANPSISPSDGDRYFNTMMAMDMFYDGTRSKWLSKDMQTLNFGRKGNIGPGLYFRGMDSVAMSQDNGYYTPFSGTVIGLTYTRNDLDAATFEVVADGTMVETLSSAAVKGHDMTLDGDFSDNSVLAIRNQAAGNTMKEVVGTVVFRWLS